MSTAKRRDTAASRGEKFLEPPWIQDPQVNEDDPTRGIRSEAKRDLEAASEAEDDTVEMMFGERIDLDDLVWSETAYVEDASAVNKLEPPPMMFGERIDLDDAFVVSETASVEDATATDNLETPQVFGERFDLDDALDAEKLPWKVDNFAAMEARGTSKDDRNAKRRSFGTEESKVELDFGEETPFVDLPMSFTSTISNSIASQPGAHYMSPGSARRKYDRMNEAATGGMALSTLSSALPEIAASSTASNVARHCISSNDITSRRGAPSASPGSARLKYDMMHSAQFREMAVPPLSTGTPDVAESDITEPENDSHGSLAPSYKDQVMQRKADESRLHDTTDTSPGAFRRYPRAVNPDDESDAELGAAIAMGEDSVATDLNSHLVEAELVIPAQAEVVKEQPRRKALIGVAAVVITAIVLGVVLGRQNSVSKDDDGETDPSPALGLSECDPVVLEVGESINSTLLETSPDTRPPCGNPNGTALSGEWFQVIGNNASYTASTCTGVFDFDEFISQINIYSGEDCQNLSCVAFKDDNIVYDEFGYAICNYGASWLAESGVRYWIRVFTFSSAGSFPIAVYPTPINDVCDAAIMLEAGQGAVQGTTRGALAGPRVRTCGSAFPVQGVPSVWYSVIGTAEELTVATCTGDSTQSELSFDNQVLVYRGECGNLMCIDGNDDSPYDTNCSEKDAVVSWYAEAGTVYYIQVVGFETAGDFNIEITVGNPQFALVPKMDSPPDNDLCENAILLQRGDSLSRGSTISATVSDFLSTEFGVCEGDSFLNNDSLPDVWYQFVGTGTWHTVSTCTEIFVNEDDSYAFIFDSHVAVYSGTCSNLTCIASNDDFSRVSGVGSFCEPTEASASWLTEAGQTYLIRVWGEGKYVTGTFYIRIEDGKIPVPDNDNCDNATLLELDQVVEGTTEAATGTSGLQLCNHATEPPSKTDVADVWYTLVGTGEVLTVSTCTEPLRNNTGIDTLLAVYTGSCGLDLSCLAENDDDPRDSCIYGNLAGVSWQSEVDTVYHIRVYGFNFAAGSFVVWAYRGTPDGKAITSSPSHAPS